MADDKKKVDRKLSSLSRFGLSGRGRGASPSRLPSLKPARDLTLGGTPKRTFTPNIVARGVKKEDAKSENDFPNKRGRGRARTSGRGGRGRGRADIISSSGVFSQGPAAQNTLAKALSGSGYLGGGGGKSDAPSSSRVTSRSIKDDVEDIDSDKVLEMVGEEGKIELDEDEVKSGNLVPITLPLASKLIQKIKQDDVKTESELSQDEEEIPGKKEIKKPVDKMPDIVLPTTDIAELFKPDAPSGQLFFVQLPDTLPIQPYSHEDDDVKQDRPIIDPKTQQSNENLDIEEQLKKFTLQNVSEGYVGKLRMHKSGKVTLQLGNVALNVSLGTPCGFLQDLVSVHIERDPPEMISLGHVNHKLIAVPDYDSLLGGNSGTDSDDEEDNDDS